MYIPAHRTSDLTPSGHVRCARNSKFPANINRIGILSYRKYPHKLKFVILRVTLFIAILAFSFMLPNHTQSISAATGERFIYTAQSGMVHVWSLKSWKDSKELCEIYRADEEEPTGTDIRAYCGEKIYTEWASAAPCTSYVTSGSTSDCTGSFFTYQGYFFRNYDTYTTTEESSASLALENCKFGKWCNEKPVMTFTGIEPLQDYEIVEVHAIIGEKTYDCYNKSTCDISIPLTANQGVWVEYWVVSSFGDESEHLTAHIRNLYRGENGGQYLVNVILPDEEIETLQDFASQTWDIFPQVDYPNQDIYIIPANETDLVTGHHLYYLAGNLIFTGEVDASECVQNGLLDNNNANTCGEEKTYQAGVDSQNAYDQQLWDAAVEYGVPPRLVKAIIIQETQFWPNSNNEYEYGLGCISEKGIDVLMNWDTENYLSVCTSQYEEDQCTSGYANMTEEQRAVVRGLALRPVGTDQEIDLITRVVRANIIQVDQTIRSYTDQEPAKITTYEDLWDFTLANYHAGNNCVSTGLKTLIDNNSQVTFENYCSLTTSCPTACLYVERVKNYAADGLPEEE